MSAGQMGIALDGPKLTEQKEMQQARGASGLHHPLQPLLPLHKLSNCETYCPVRSWNRGT